MNIVLIPEQARTLGRFLFENYAKLRPYTQKITTFFNSFTKDSRDIFIPSETALLPDKKSYFDIVPETECEQKTIARWKLLAFLAARKEGRLYLFIRPEREVWGQSLLDNYKIEAVILSL